MSMFKKMREKINDEVNSATNRIQNINLMDQLTMSISQQVGSSIIDTNSSSQILPEPSLHTANNQFSLVDDGEESRIPSHRDEDIGNSELSPQHVLFNEQNIHKIQSSLVDSSNDSFPKKYNNQAISSDFNQVATTDDNFVIDIDELSSDIEDESQDIEIDLFSTDHNTAIRQSIDGDQRNTPLPHLSKRYRDVVRAFRTAHEQFQTQIKASHGLTTMLTEQLNSTKNELEGFKSQLQPNLNETSIGTGLISHNSDKSSCGSPQMPGKSGNKTRDLEKLLAKCKESLKQKNSHIQSLKKSLSGFESLKGFGERLRSELNDLRDANESWMLSVAENKKVMHLELDSKTAEINNLKREINESNNQIANLRASIQALESRLVSTSAAHQKERESLTRELKAGKNEAIKNLQRDHETNVERIKLNFEKSIESLKSQLLRKDEQIISSAKQCQEANEKHDAINNLLIEATANIKRLEDGIEQSNNALAEEKTKSAILETEIADLKSRIPNETPILNTDSQVLEEELISLRSELSAIKDEKAGLETRLQDSENDNCKFCTSITEQSNAKVDAAEQKVFELSSRNDILSSANSDQEKMIQLLKEKDLSVNQAMISLRAECDELARKNDGLTRLLSDNEAEIKNQQSQLEQLAALESESVDYKRMYNASEETVSRLNHTISDKCSEIATWKDRLNQIEVQMADYKDKLTLSNKKIDDVTVERDSLATLVEQRNSDIRDGQEKLVVAILAVMKNLENPNESPGSEKSLHLPSQDLKSPHEQSFPDPMILLKDLSNIALERTSSHMSNWQRLELMSRDNESMNQELIRLREDLERLSRERDLVSQKSMDEADRLRLENQALIHDRQNYIKQIHSLEIELKSLMEQQAKETSELRDELSRTRHDNKTLQNDVTELRNAQPYDHTYQIKSLENLLKQQCDDNERLRQDLSSLQDRINAYERDAPDFFQSTEFQFLKNIVLQLLLGKETLILARVISAVFHYDEAQIDEICKTQELVQSALRQ